MKVLILLLLIENLIVINEIQLVNCKNFDEKINGIVVNPRIINSIDAKIGEFPWMAQIVYLLGSHRCGGSIIDRYHILTAAHCVYNQVDLNRFIYVGKYYKQSNEGAIKYEISEIIIHESFDYIDNFPINDIAIIRLKTPIKFRINTNSIGAINSIPLQKRPVGFDDKLIVSGWGLTNFPNKTDPIKLQKQYFFRDYDEQCLANYPKNFKPESQLCVKNIKNISTCYGDSGSGFVRQLSPYKNEFDLIGIVSYGMIGCPGSYPIVQTRIDYFIDWINEKLEKYYE